MSSLMRDTATDPGDNGGPQMPGGGNDDEPEESDGKRLIR